MITRNWKTLIYFLVWESIFNVWYDILIKEKLDNLQKEFPTRFNVSYTVDKAPWWWQLSGETGFVTKQMVERCVFSANNKQKFKIFVCGPQPMVSLSSIPSILIDNDLYI